MEETKAPELGMDGELQSVIEKHLPAQTMGVLRKRLERLASVEGEMTALERLYGVKLTELERAERELHAFKQRQDALERSEDAVEIREDDCTLREEKCRHREEVIDLKEAHATDRVAEMRSVVSDVFGNNRYKYERQTSVPVAVAGHSGQHADPSYGGCSTPPIPGCVEQHTSTEVVKGEGDVPSA